MRVLPLIGVGASVLCTLLGGCTTLSVDGAHGPQGRRTFVGVVHVDAPIGPMSGSAAARVRVWDVTTLGLRLGDGVSLGYAKDRLLSIPLDCRLVIFVRDLAQMQHAQSLIQHLNTEGSPECLAREP
jgi:hypothetical protein